jgi:type I restriction enzyme R subunit
VVETVRVIDWNNPENNDFFLASQFWVSGEMHKRRADLVGVVNGLPLVFVEFKAYHRRLEKLRRLIEEYNSGSMNVEAYFSALLRLAEELDEEERRSISEGLSEEELAVFDILTKPEISITEKERARVKQVARELLETLKREKLVLDWRKRQRSRAEVRVAIEDSLDRLPENYTPKLYRAKCEAVYQHAYDSYYGPGESIYAKAG